MAKKECKLVYLNPDITWTRKGDLEQAEKLINEQLEDGWELHQVMSPNDILGAMVGVFLRDKRF